MIIKELFRFVGTKIKQKSNTKQILYLSRFQEIDIAQRCMNREFLKIKKSEKIYRKKCKVLKISDKNFSVVFVGLVDEWLNSNINY